nr:MAG TPA: hypothetical protein [Caudoviricetes sp.]
MSGCRKATWKALVGFQRFSILPFSNRMGNLSKPLPIVVSLVLVSLVAYFL